MQKISKICYITGTRADFGLMFDTLNEINQDPELDLSLIVTGAHLSKTYGHTIDEIKKANFKIAGTVPVNLENTTRASMSIALGQTIPGITTILAELKPDIVLLLGDRGEMLAAAIAAMHLNLHIIHIHGGERSGTIDEMMRHAISKLSHYHFTATTASRKRLIKMGEHAKNVFVTGAPGLDSIKNIPLINKEELFKSVGFDCNKPTALLVYHPVVQEIELLSLQMGNIINACEQAKLQVICLTPNSDAGHNSIQKIIEQKTNSNFKVFTHLARNDYLSWMAAVDVMLGNSSSGIIEAASVNTKVINIGSRQNLREYGDNVTHTSTDCNEIFTAISQAISQTASQQKTNMQNIYGDGTAAKQITKLLKSIKLESEVLNKSNAY